MGYYQRLLRGATGGPTTFYPSHDTDVICWVEGGRDTYQDNDGGTGTPATANNTRVGTWVNQISGAPFSVLYSSGIDAPRPLLKTGASGINGNAALLFDGGGIYLVSGDFDDQLAEFTMSANGVGFFFLIETASSRAANETLLGSSNTATTGIRWACGVGSANDAGQGLGWCSTDGSKSLGDGSGLGSSTVHVMSYIFSTTSKKVRVDGVEVNAEADTSMPTSDFRITVGRENHQSAGYPFGGKIAAIIIVNDLPDATQIANHEEYLATLGGVTLP